MNQIYHVLSQQRKKFSFDKLIVASTFLCGGIVIGDAYYTGTINQQAADQLKEENELALKYFEDRDLHLAKLGTNKSIHSADESGADHKNKSGKTVPRKLSLEELSLDYSFFNVEENMEKLSTNGFLVVDNVLTSKQLHLLAAEIRNFNQAHSERFYFPNNDDTIRNDSITFLNNRDSNLTTGKGYIILSRTISLLRGIGNIFNSSQFFKGFQYNKNNQKAKRVKGELIKAISSDSGSEKKDNKKKYSDGEKKKKKCKKRKKDSEKEDSDSERKKRDIDKKNREKSNQKIETSEMKENMSNQDPDDQGDAICSTNPTHLYHEDLDYMEDEKLILASTGKRKWIGVPEKVQLSIYSADGEFYVPHRDGEASSRFPWYGEGLLNYLRTRSYRKRYLTAILYCNDGEEWERERDGGCLRLYLGTHLYDDNGETASKTIDISPKGGRLILFDSNTMLHEVTPSHRERLALTIFFTINQ